MGLGGWETTIFEVAKAAVKGYVSSRSLPNCPACPPLSCGEVHTPPISVSCPSLKDSCPALPSVPDALAPAIAVALFVGFIGGWTLARLPRRQEPAPRLLGKGV